MKAPLYIASLLAVFGVSFEVACRIEDRVRYGMPLLSAIRDQEDLVIRDRAGMHGRPNAQYQRFVLNSLGMRGPEASVAKPAGTVRVVTVGASETFGLYESDGREYPRQLEDLLRREMPMWCAPRSPLRAEVLNAAIFGMSLPTAEEDLRLRVAATRPDVIVAYPTPPHYLDDDLPRAARPDSSGRTLPASLAARLHPRAADRLREQVKALLPESIADWLRRRDTERSLRRHPPGWRWTSIPKDRLTAYEADLRILVGTIHSLGASPILITHGNAFPSNQRRDPSLLARWERFYPRATGETIVAFDSAARLVTLRVADDSSVAVIDAQRILYDRMTTTGSRFFQEYSHFTDVGAALLASLVAETMHRELRTRGVQACATQPSIVAAGEASAERSPR